MNKKLVLTKLVDAASLLVKGFCPTGEGGGRDNSCGGGGGGGGGYAQARTKGLKAISGIAKSNGLKELKGVFADEDFKLFTGPKGKGADLKVALVKGGYKKGDGGPLKGPGEKFFKEIATSTTSGKMKVFASVDDDDDDGSSLTFYGKGNVQA